MDKYKAGKSNIRHRLNESIGSGREALVASTPRVGKNLPHFLRVGGLSILLLAGGMDVHLDATSWLLLGIGFAPDLSVLGYHAGTRIGNPPYNVMHRYVGPLGRAVVLEDGGRADT